MSRKPTQSGSAVLFGLVLVILIAGIVGWFVLKKDTTNELVSSEISQASDDAQAEQHDHSHDAPEVQPLPPEENAPDASSVYVPSEPSVAGPVDVNRVMSTRAIGNPNAPIHIIEFASLTCSHCAHFHNDVLPKLKEKYVNTGKVYIEFREFPLNDPALKATITARCLPAERYDGFVSLLFKNQEKWANGVDYMSYLKQNAKLAGLSDEQFQACQDNGEIKTRLASVMQDAQDRWKISATPTFIINNGAQTISGAQPLENFERAFRAVTSGVVGEAPKVE